MIDIVIDIETLGTRPGCEVIEIGACAVDNRTGAIVANFSRRVASNYTFAQLHRRDVMGRVSDDMKDTVEWWLADKDREDVLSKIMSGGTQRPKQAPEMILCEFAVWCDALVCNATEARFWGNGPTFDLAILSRAFDTYRITCPWHHTWERCVRTALEQAGYEKGSTSWTERGPRHRALNDARHEARKLFYAGALGEVSAIIKRLHQRGVIKGEVR
jgi:hypothetical protein